MVEKRDNPKTVAKNDSLNDLLLCGGNARASSVASLEKVLMGGRSTRATRPTRPLEWTDIPYLKVN